ncbi:MAG: hypothetical protein GWN58_23595 [Anaerolineae bacterium]|nr:hypothetical protein [Anaerolineae bacterium]
MTYDDFVFGDRLMDMRVQEEHRRAGVRRMAREARRDGPAGRWTLGLNRLGNVLERLAVWLQRDAEPPDSVVAG